MLRAKLLSRALFSFVSAEDKEGNFPLGSFSWRRWSSALTWLSFQTLSVSKAKVPFFSFLARISTFQTKSTSTVDRTDGSRKLKFAELRVLLLWRGSFSLNKARNVSKQNFEVPVRESFFSPFQNLLFPKVPKVSNSGDFGSWAE